MKQDDIWDAFVDIIETCRGNLSDLRELVRTASEVRAAGSCQCSDDEACKFVRERDELRALLKEVMGTLDAKWPASLFERVHRAVEDGAELGDGWVRAEDRLPDCGVAVLTATKCDGFQVLSLSCISRPKEWVGLGHLSWRLEEVTHWQPLPDPPKAEK